MKFELPLLPFPKSALAPYIGAETVEYHYEKHHKGYLDKLNKLVKGKPEAEKQPRRADPHRKGRRLQQRGAGVEPQLLLALAASRAAAASRAVSSRRWLTARSAPLTRSKSNSPRRRSASSDRAGPGS